MYEWRVEYSNTETKGTRISCEMFIAEVYAEDEGEVREIMAEEEPGMKIDKITRGEYIPD